MLQLQTIMPPSDYTVSHLCTGITKNALREANCKKPHHVHCFICNVCSNEFHLVKEKYVSSFGAE